MVIADEADGVHIVNVNLKRTGTGNASFVTASELLRTYGLGYLLEPRAPRSFAAPRTPSPSPTSPAAASAAMPQAAVTETDYLEALRDRSLRRMEAARRLIDEVD